MSFLYFHKWNYQSANQRAPVPGTLGDDFQKRVCCQNLLLINLIEGGINP